MAWARPNPLGLPVEGVTLVTIGKGRRIHLWDAVMPVVIRGKVVGTGIHLCQSGKNAGRGGPSGVTTNPKVAISAAFVTCYRCAKIAQMNKGRYGALLRPRG